MRIRGANAQLAHGPNPCHAPSVCLCLSNHLEDDCSLILIVHNACNHLQSVVNDFHLR